MKVVVEIKKKNPMGCPKTLKEDKQEPKSIQKKTQMVPKGLQQQQPNEPKTAKVSKSLSKIDVFKKKHQKP